jgi:hypothetical protein
MTDAQCAGIIVTDVTRLRDEGLLEIIGRKVDHDGVVQVERHYRVEYDMVPIVEGRNLRYESRWPAVDHNVTAGKRKRAGTADYQVLETAQVSIASAFRPGTR